MACIPMPGYLAIIKRKLPEKRNNVCIITIQAHSRDDKEVELVFKIAKVGRAIAYKALFRVIKRLLQCWW